MLLQVVQSEKHKMRSFYQGERSVLLLPLAHVVTYPSEVVSPAFLKTIFKCMLVLHNLRQSLFNIAVYKMLSLSHSHNPLPED